MRNCKHRRSSANLGGNYNEIEKKFEKCLPNMCSSNFLLIISSSIETRVITAQIERAATVKFAT